MAHSLSAKKRIRQNDKRNARNRWRKERVRTATRAFDDALAAGNLDEAEQLLKKASSVVDKVASTPALHKNTAARRRSAMAKRLNAARSSTAAG